MMTDRKVKIPLRVPLRIEEFASEFGLSLQQVAKRAGLSKSYVTHIKNGSRRWNEETLAKLSMAFGVSPSKLIADSPSPAGKFMNGPAARDTKKSAPREEVVKIVTRPPSDSSQLSLEAALIAYSHRELRISLPKGVKGKVYAVESAQIKNAPEKSIIVIEAVDGKDIRAGSSVLVKVSDEEKSYFSVGKMLPRRRSVSIKSGGVEKEFRLKERGLPRARVIGKVVSYVDSR